MKLGYLFGNPRKKRKPKKSVAMKKANPKKFAKVVKKTKKKKNPQTVLMKNFKTQKVAKVSGVPKSSEIAFMKQTIADAKKVGQSQATIRQLNAELKNAMKAVSKANQEIKSLKTKGYQTNGIIDDESTGIDKKKVARKVAKNKKKQSSKKAIKQKRLEALKKAREAKKNKKKSTKTGASVMAKKKKKVSKKKVAKKVVRRKASRPAKKKYSVKKRKSSRKGKISVKTKVSRNKKSAMIRVRSNPMIGSSQANKAVQEWTGHSIAEAGGLVVGGALYSTINDMAIKYLPANVAAMLQKTGPFAGSIIPLVLGVLGTKYIKNEHGKAVAKGLVGSSAVALGATLYAMTLKSSLAGIKYTPSMSGVKYTPSMGASEYSNADFGAVEYTPHMGASEYSKADFGSIPQMSGEYSNADFGEMEDDFSEGEDEGVLI